MKTAISRNGSEEQDYILESEDNILAFAQATRKGIVKDLLKAGTPTDPDNVKIVLGALKDMDSQAIGRKRIKVEEKHNDIQAQSAAMIARVLAETNGGDCYKVIEGIAREIPTLPKHIPDPVLVEGETEEISKTNHTYETFTALFAPDDE